MVQTVLLGMDDELARFLTPAIRHNTNQLEILNNTVSRMHDLSVALEKFNPDILLIASDHMNYDTQNYLSELVNGLYHITQDPRFSMIRLAVIADGNTDQDTLSRLAVFVRDIFLTEPGTGRLDLQQMTEQLARPANLQNVSQFLANQIPQNANPTPNPQYSPNQQPFDQGQQFNQAPQYDQSPQYTSSTPPTVNTVPTASANSNDGEDVEKYRKLVELYKAQLAMKNRQNQGDFVPKQDYDNLLAKARQILDQGVSDQQIKDLFQQVINSNTNYSGKLHEANDMIEKQNELINELSDKLKNIESRKGSTPETQNLRSQLNEAQRQVNQNANNGGYGNPNGDYGGGRQQGYDYGRNDNYGNPNNGYGAPNQPDRGGRGYGYDDPQPQRPQRPHRPNQQRPPRPNGRPRPNRPTALPAPIRRPNQKPSVKKEDSFVSKLMENKVALIGLIGGALLILLMLLVIINKPSDNSNSGVSSTQTSSSSESFDALIKKGKYADAAKAYPNRAVEAENKMLEDTDVTDKATFASDIMKNSDDDPIKFDNFYFKEEYPQAVKLLDNSDDQNLKKLSDARRVMASYAYMKAGKISKAESTAKPLKNKNLNERIRVYKKFSDSNDKLKAKIKSGSLSSSEKKKAENAIKDNESKMDKL